MTNNKKHNNNNGLNPNFSKWFYGDPRRVAFYAHRRIFLIYPSFILAVFIIMVIYAVSNCLDILVMVLDLDPLLLCALIPIKSYSNAETEKAKILSENKKKAGIYL
jgi:hypothetical protein